MKTALRATAILSSGTFVRVAAGIVVAKAWAVLVGPSGVGSLGLLQSLTGLVGIVASLGVASGMVRLGAGALGRGDAAAAAALRQATMGLSTAAALVGAVLVVALRVPLGESLLDGPLSLHDALWTAGAVAAAVLTGAALGVLNAYQRVGAMARAAVWGSLTAAAAGLVVLWALRGDGLVEAYTAGVAATWAVTAVVLRRAAPREPVRSTWAARRAATRDLLRFGVPFTASALVGTGVTLALPVLVRALLNLESVGMYRAAFTVSAGYLGFLLAAMGQDYFPRLSAASDDAGVLGRIVNDQLRLVLLVGGPVVLVAQATAPWTIPLLYTSGFEASVPVLQWQLTGELFRFWAWSFSFVILARSSASVFFVTEAVGGAALLGGTWVGLRMLGLTGSGIGFAVAYVVYGVVVWALVRRNLAIRLEGRTWALMATATGLSLAGHGAQWLGDGPWFRVVSVAATLGFAAYAAVALLREVRRPADMPVGATSGTMRTPISAETHNSP